MKTYREILEIDCVSDSGAPPKSKTMSETKYLDTKASQECFDIFSKKYFFAIFPKNVDTSKSKISRFGRSGDLTDPEWVHTYGRIGQISNFSILRCRKFVEILRKNIFGKNSNFSWVAFASKYFVSDIV